MKQQRRGQWLMIASMTIFGTLGPFVDAIGVSSGELALYRAIIAAVIIGLFLLLRRRQIAVSDLKRTIPVLLLSGAALGLNWMLLFEGYRYSISMATISYYFAPVLVMVISPLLFKEKLTWKQVICFVMSTLGLVLILCSGDLSGSNLLLAVGFGLGAAVFYATVILLNKFIKGMDGISRTFLQFLTAIAVLIPYVACTGGVTLQDLNTAGWVCLVIVGVVHTGITYCMYFSALQSITGQKAALLSYIDPLVAVILSVTYMREELNLWQILGGALILGFTLLNELQIPKKSK